MTTPRLADLPDVLTVTQLCAVLQISDRQYRRLRHHHAFPIPELPSLGMARVHRFSKAVVQQFIESNGVARLRRTA